MWKRAIGRRTWAAGAAVAIASVVVALLATAGAAPAATDEEYQAMKQTLAQRDAEVAGLKAELQAQRQEVMRQLAQVKNMAEDELASINADRASLNKLVAILQAENQRQLSLLHELRKVFEEIRQRYTGALRDKGELMTRLREATARLPQPVAPAKSDSPAPGPAAKPGGEPPASK